MIHELTSPQKNFQTSEFTEMPGKGNVVLQIVKFEEILKNKTTIILNENCRSLAIRDAMINSGIEKV